MAILIKTFGFILHLIPNSSLEALIDLLSKIFMFVPSERRRILLSNLQNAFPVWSKSKRRRVGHESTKHMMEMGFFSLVYPFMAKERRRRTVQYSVQTEADLKELRKRDDPVLFLIPHVSLFETLATSPYFRPKGEKKLGAIFRPNRNLKLNRWIDSARRSSGLETFSRKEGLLKAKSFLRKGNWLIILFDQNAGDRGVLDLFLGRMVSYTSLPDSLVRHSKAIPVFAFPKRVGFFQTKLTLEKIPTNDKFDVSAQAHSLLENMIKSDPNGLPEWLWSHAKWKVNARPESRYRIIVKRNHVIARKTIERKTDFFVRMPNWLGDIAMAIPIVKAIRKGRPDVRFSLVCQPQYVPLLKKFDLGENYLPLPKKSAVYYWTFRKLITQSPENYLLFTNSMRGDIEAFLSGSPQRFGVKPSGRKRPFLSHCFDPESMDGFDWNKVHQTVVWEKMSQHFGLMEKVSKSPLSLSGITKVKNKVGVIAGSSNTPLKRWAIENWISLINQILNESKKLEINLYGTIWDKLLMDEIEISVGSSRLKNLAGKTDLAKLSVELASCSCVIGNDTGGMHLANMVGTPSVILYGPTNYLRTGTYYDAPTIPIIVDGHSTSGHKNINRIKVKQVIEAFLEYRKY